MQSRRLVISQRALDDLLADHSYIADFNPAAGRRLLDGLNAKMISLAKLGMTGVAREFFPGLRAYPYRGRCIYFIIVDGAMIVLRVLHGHQDISAEHFTNQTD
jgi:plasmid stabilization system protein ParE